MCEPAGHFRLLTVVTIVVKNPTTKKVYTQLEDPTTQPKNRKQKNKTNQEKKYKGQNKLDFSSIPNDEVKQKTIQATTIVESRTKAKPIFPQIRRAKSFVCLHSVRTYTTLQQTKIQPSQTNTTMSPP